jgi:hypothetical protein
MSMKRFFVVLALVVLLGMLCVYQHSRSIRAGYEINRLLARRHQLIEEKRGVDYALLRMKNPQSIRGQVGSMHLGLVLPGEERPPAAIARNGDGMHSRTR